VKEERSALVNAKNVTPGVVGGVPPRGFPVDVRTRGFDLTPPMYRHAIDHIAAKVAKYARVISNLTVRLQDINGPKGGIDKRCRIELTIAGFDPVIIDETDQDAYAAIDVAGERLRKVVSQVLDERRSRRRQAGRKLVRHIKLLH
jgi:ribosome-associated translation inhibitor RaiA